MREAFLYARRCCRNALPEDEIFSLCYRALRASVKNFKAGKIRFFAYSKVYVRGQINREWASKHLVKNTPRKEILSLNEPSMRISDYQPDFFGLERNRDTRSGSAPSCEPTTEPDFSSIFQKETRALLDKYLQSPLLKKRHSEVLKMKYFEDLNYAEIGRRLGVCREAARITHSEALGILKTIITRSGIDPR
jgi:RNA polymerase sigma factor (sigma-70 family)